ncbi:rhamnan synthesis F family protein [Parvibaculum sp. MBR-TMA-1.3b-4.2]|jgi:lipopolysaccharide biosynthesis protein
MTGVERFPDELSDVAEKLVELTPGLYELSFRQVGAPLPVAQIGYQALNGARHHLSVPALDGSIALLRVRENPVRLAVPDGLEMVCRPFSLPDLRHLLWRRKSDYKARLNVPGFFSIVPLLAARGREGRELKKSLSILRKFGFAVSSANFQCTPGLFDEWPPSGAVLPMHRSLQKSDTALPSFAVVLHLYYRDLWPEFAWCLSRLSMPFRLILTLNDSDPDLESDVRQLFPDAEIHVMENRGRDVGPFMELLRQGHLDRFDTVCKLHGKRSAVDGARALLGHVWRRANLIDLVGSDEQVAHILRRFAEAPDIGMIGSARFHFPNGHFDEEGVWGENKEAVQGLIRRLGTDPEGRQAEYYAGTMFWASCTTLAALKTLGLSLQDFPPEHGALDGDLNHALERLFGMAPALNGQRLEDAPVVYEPSGVFPPSPGPSPAR